VSPPESAEAGRGVYVEKPKSNIFTVMLLMSLVAILVAIVFLCLEMAQYGWDRNRKAPSTVWTTNSQQAVAFALTCNPYGNAPRRHGEHGENYLRRESEVRPIAVCYFKPENEIT